MSRYDIVRGFTIDPNRSNTSKLIKGILLDKKSVNKTSLEKTVKPPVIHLSTEDLKTLKLLDDAI